MYFNEAMRALKELKDNSGMNYKKEVIERYKNNKIFLDILYFLLNTDIVTGINNKKLYKNIQDVPYDTSIKTLEECMEYLKKNNTGTDKDVQTVKFFLERFKDEWYYEMLEEIVTKKLKLGCNKKLVNSVIPNFVPDFKVMLGTSIENCKLKGNEKIFISQKLNGNRCVFYNGELRTRQGKVYKNLDHILKDVKELDKCMYDASKMCNSSFKNHPLLYDFVLDGELLYKNKEGLSDSEAFQIGTGLANSDEVDKTDLKYVVFDVLTKEEFDKEKSNNSYSCRKKYLQDISDIIDNNNIKNIEVVKMFYEGYDHNQIQKWLDYAEKNDVEGVMINLDTPYECKRTKKLIKVKKFFDIDLKCVGLELGDGKYKDTLGYILCEYEGNIVKCGSGFTDEQRDDFFKNPKKIIGKTVTIKYKEKTQNKDGGKSLQFPVFICVRYDK